MNWLPADIFVRPASDDDTLLKAAQAFVLLELRLHQL